MNNVQIVFVALIVFFSEIAAMQCVDNGFTAGQHQSITASKEIIDVRWKELITSTKSPANTKTIQAINDKIRKYRDGRAYYLGTDIEVLNVLVLYIERLRINWYRSCMEKAK